MTMQMHEYHKKHVFLPAIAAGVSESVARHAAQMGGGRAVDIRDGMVLTRRSRKPRGRWSRPPEVWIHGTDEGQIWSARVPSTIDNIADALEYMKPPEVRRARPEWVVLRQGDVWAIGKPNGRQLYASMADDNARLPRRHRVTRPDGAPWLELVHDGGEHETVVLPGGYVWEFHQSREVGGCGD